MKLLENSFASSHRRKELIIKFGLIQVLIALLALLFLQCRNKSTTIPVIHPALDTTSVITTGIDSNYIPIASYYPEETKEKLRNLEKKKFSKGAIADQVLDFLKRGTNDFGEEFKFIDLVFVNRTAQVDPKFNNEITELAEIMNQFPKMKIKLLSYTDNVGYASENEKLSQDRAVAIQQGLSNQGISVDRIEIKAFGGKYPVADNKTFDGRMLNNRIEMMILNL